MRTQKALHRAQSKSLDGHVRFVALINGVATVMTLFDLAHCRNAMIQVAFYAGKTILPKGMV